jgi:putative spermidine/putrescine transport system permease protein
MDPSLDAKIPLLVPKQWPRVVIRLWHVALYVLTALGVVYLVAPSVVLAGVSFNEFPHLSFPPAHWTLASYSQIPAVLYDAFFLSVKVAVIATLISTVLAVPACYWIARRPGALPRFLDAFVRSPLQIPHIILGLSLYQIYVVYEGFSGIALRSQFIGLLAAHIILVTPYVVVTCVSRIESEGRELENAAAGLGASPLSVFFRVSLPAIRQALIASSMLGVLVSFDNVPISLFLAGPSTTPLPVQLFTMSEHELRPSLYAAATLTMLVSLVVVLLLEKLVGLRSALRQE